MKEARKLWRGIRLFDLDKSGREWCAEYPHWRSIIEAVIRLDVLPGNVGRLLHHELVNSGLSKVQARLVANELRRSVLSHLLPNEYLLRNGEMIEKGEPWLSDPGRTPTTRKRQMLRYLRVL